MILSPAYRQKFDNLKQKFGCNDLELEALLRESASSNRLASIESLIDQQLNDLNTPRGRRIYAVDWAAREPVHRWERKPKKYDDERMSAREIKEVFDNIHPLDVRFSSVPSSSRKRLAKLRIRSAKNRIARLRQKIPLYRQSSAQRLNRAISSLRTHGKREILREGKRLARNAARRHLRRVLAIY